jgi:hypothetical protein
MLWPAGVTAPARPSRPRVAELLGGGFPAFQLMNEVVRLFTERAQGFRPTAPTRYDKLARMDYHDNFWVVAGGVAPVIALAAVVSLGSAHDLRTALFTSDSTLSNVPLAQGTRYRNKIRKIARPNAISGNLQNVNIGVQCYVLAVSLLSLANGRNDSNPLVVAILEILGLAALFVTTVVTSTVKFRRRLLEGAAAARELHRREGDDDDDKRRAVAD